MTDIAYRIWSSCYRPLHTKFLPYLVIHLSSRFGHGWMSLVRSRSWLREIVLTSLRCDLKGLILLPHPTFIANVFPTIVDGFRWLPNWLTYWLTDWLNSDLTENESPLPPIKKRPYQWTLFISTNSRYISQLLVRRQCRKKENLA